MPSGSSITKPLIIGVLALLGIIAAIYFANFSRQKALENEVQPLDSSDIPEAAQSNPDTLAEGTYDPTKAIKYEDLVAVTDTESWVTVQTPTYTFKHPNYLIKEEGDFYIMAYEPVVGQEFSGMAIKKPFKTDNIISVMNETIENSRSSVGIYVTRQPTRIEMLGFKDAYLYEYELESGYNSGPGKFFALQSPFTDEWVTIQYPVNDNAENIRKSFEFIQ